MQEGVSYVQVKTKLLNVNSCSLRLIYLFIIDSYTKYKLDKKTETESERRHQHVLTGYSPTHILENRSTISEAMSVFATNA